MPRNRGTHKFHVGAGVRRAQKLSGVTNEEIASGLNVSRMQVHRYRNQKDMRFGTMCQIANRCSMTIYQFIEVCEEGK
jgi:transcriptional regulator with XRE-family HTH domain